jgi:hypothetical protein
MSGEEVAKAFVGHFYQAFDSNADQLAGLFVSFISKSNDESFLLQLFNPSQSLTFLFPPS